MIHLLNANALQVPLPDESVHCVVTSPPYWGLRSYAGIEPIEWPAVTYTPMPGLAPVAVAAHTCHLGLEKTPEAYVAHLVAVFREVRRVMREDAVLWLNLGDSYATNPGNGRGGETVAGGLPHRSGQDKTRAGLKSQAQYRLRSDLTPEQRAYVLSELAKAAVISEATQEGRE